jgi:RiboL-PSP-HEPN
MLPREIGQQRDILNSLFAKISSLPTDDLELRSHWARYLCVLVEGHVETAVRAIYDDYARRAAGAQPVVNYAAANLRRFQNPNMERILELTSRFSPEWAASLRAQTDGRLKDAVDSVVSLRNQIAHGQSVGVTYSRIKDYYEHVSEVLDLLDTQCGG